MRKSMAKEMEAPFYCGTQAADWYCNNCDRCVKGHKPADGQYPKESTMRKYISIGKECKLKYAIDIGFITGEVEKKIVDQIGRNEHGHIAQTCMLFSDNEDDGYKPKPRPKPDKGGPNQMVMPFIIESCLNQKELA